jgi:hypothetical protein
MGLPVLGHPNLILSMLVLDLVEGLEDTYRRAGRVEVIAQLPSQMAGEGLDSYLTMLVSIICLEE